MSVECMHLINNILHQYLIGVPLTVIGADKVWSVGTQILAKTEGKFINIPYIASIQGLFRSSDHGFPLDCFTLGNSNKHL